MKEENTTYVYPYKHVVTVPKFKTPLDSRYIVFYKIRYPDLGKSKVCM
jgi:hypothetical protein